MKDLENDESHIFVHMKIQGLTLLLTQGVAMAV